MNRLDTKTALEQLERLPVVPRVAAALCLPSSEYLSTTESLVNLASSDPAITALLFRVAGGASQGIGPAIGSVADALDRLGVDAARSVIRTAAAGPHAAPAGAWSEDLAALWLHSVTCAVWAECIAETTESPFRSVAYTAGLLHDLGKLALLALECEAGKSNQDSSDGASHTLAGKWLSESWRLPDYLTDVIWLHHHSLATITALRHGHADLIATVGLANALAKENASLIPDDLLRHFHFGATELDALRAEARSRLDTWSDSLPQERDAVAPLDSMRARTDVLDKLVSTERQNRQLRALNDLHTNLCPRMPLESVLAKIVECVRTGLQVAPGLCYVADAHEQWVRGKSWRTLDDTPRDLLLSLRGATSSERVDLDAQLLCAIQSLASGAKNGAPESLPDSPWRRGGFAALPVMDLGSQTAHIIFDSAGSRRAFGSDDAPELAAFVKSCGAALRRHMTEERLTAHAEAFASILESHKPLAAQVHGPDALKTFVAGAAHHINNPLTVISGRAQQLVGKMATPAEVKALDDIVAHSHRITRILGDLMAFSASQPPRLEPALINAVIQQTVAGVLQRLTAKKIRVVESYGDGLPRVRVDRRQFGQAILNLIANAESSMGDTGGVLTVETKADADQKTIRIRIADTGHGISPEVAHRLFTPFFSTRKEGEGLGLGLAACRGIILAHDGAIRLASTPGPGAAFEITLPVAADPAAFPALRTPVNGGASSAARQRTILIANDDNDLREILTETLKKRGYLVHAVSNGTQALETVRTRPVDLVLMDTRMPERDGLSVLTELSSQYASLPVILITNRATEEETEEAIRLGARSCLSKPFEIKRLLSEVERLVVNA